jgi:secondary thiamine-phosphate synthase enzyme
MRTHRLTLDTTGRRILDITEPVLAFVREGGKDGLLSVFVPHATAGLAVMETGAGSEEDLEEAIERLLPRDRPYRHSHGSPGHGADHLLPAFVSPSLVLPVEGGEVVLGTWQRVVLVDTNRENNRRQIVLSIVPG